MSNASQKPTLNYAQVVLGKSTNKSTTPPAKNNNRSQSNQNKNKNNTNTNKPQGQSFDKQSQAKQLKPKNPKEPALTTGNPQTPYLGYPPLGNPGNQMYMSQTGLYPVPSFGASNYPYPYIYTQTQPQPQPQTQTQNWVPMGISNPTPLVKRKKSKLSLQDDSGQEVDIPKTTGDKFAVIAPDIDTHGDGRKPDGSSALPHRSSFVPGTPTPTGTESTIDTKPPKRKPLSLTSSSDEPVVSKSGVSTVSTDSVDLSPAVSLSTAASPFNVGGPELVHSAESAEPPKSSLPLDSETAAKTVQPTEAKTASKASDASTPVTQEPQSNTPVSSSTTKPSVESSLSTTEPKVTSKPKAPRKVYKIHQLRDLERMREMDPVFYNSVKEPAVEYFSCIARTGAPPKGKSHSYQRGQSQKTKDIMPDFGLARTFQKDQFGDQPELGNRAESAWVPKHDDSLEIRIGTTLNKATPDNVNTILTMLFDLNPNKKITKEFMHAFGKVLFEKAIREPGFSPLYIQIGTKFTKSQKNPYFANVVEDVKVANEKIVASLRSVVLTCAKDMLITPPTPTEEDRNSPDPYWIHEVEHKCREFEKGNIRFIGESIAAGFLSDKKLRAVFKLLFQEFPIGDFLKVAGDEQQRTQILDRWTKNRPPLPNPFRFDLFSLFFLTITSSIGTTSDPSLSALLKDRLSSLKGILEYFHDYPGIPLKQKFALMDLIDLVDNDFVVNDVQRQVTAVTKSTVQQNMQEQADETAAVIANEKSRMRGKSYRNNDGDWKKAPGSKRGGRNKTPNILPRGRSNYESKNRNDFRSSSRPKTKLFTSDIKIVNEFIGLIDDLINNDYDLEDIEFHAEYKRISKSVGTAGYPADVFAHLLLTYKDLSKDQRPELNKVIKIVLDEKLAKPFDLGKAMALLGSEINVITEDWANFPSLLGKEIKKALVPDHYDDVRKGFEKLYKGGNNHIETLSSFLTE